MRALVALALLLVSCVEPTPECQGRFRLDASLTPSQHARVVLAGEKWNALAGRDVVTFDDQAACTIRVEEHENLGSWRAAEGDLVLSPARMHDHAPGCAALADDCFEAVVLHELGHALGLHHVDGRAVMAPDGELLTELAEDDRIECVRSGVC